MVRQLYGPERMNGLVNAYASPVAAEGRIYFAGRNADNLSQTGYIEIDITRPERILKLSEKPVLGLGELGTILGPRRFSSKASAMANLAAVLATAKRPT